MEDNGHLREDVYYNVTGNQLIHNHMGFPHSQDYSMFMEILKNIEYNENFVNIANDFTKDFHGKINVMHIRSEIDGISHWARINNMHELEYQNKLIQKYIQFIEDNICKDDDTIILCHELNENIREYLDKNNYKYHFINKTQNGRELNAIVDLLIGSQCNNVFIYSAGSTFSVYLHSRLPEDIKAFCVDLNHLEPSS
jgi:glutaredoxin-related protein